MLKGISRFFGRAFFGLGISLIITLLFVSALYSEIDGLKDGIMDVAKQSLREYGAENIINENPQLKQIDESCKTNQQMKECLTLNELKKDPGTLLEQPEMKNQIEGFSSQIDGVVVKIKDYEGYITFSWIMAFLLIFIGVCLIYFGVNDGIEVGNNIGYSLTSAGLFGFIFYKYLFIYLLIRAKDSLIPVKQGLMGVYVENGYKYLMEFFKSGLDKAANVALYTLLIGMVLWICFYIMKKKRFKRAAISK